MSIYIRICVYIPYNQKYWRKEYLAVCQNLGYWQFLFWRMVRPGYNEVDCQTFLLKYQYITMIIRATRTRNDGITSLYCDVIPTFCTGVIILANIMLAVVDKTAKLSQ